jgi:hypothetical protein
MDINENNNGENLTKPKPVRKIGIYGFILSCLGIFSYGIASIPGFICSIIGIKRKSKPILLSWFGLILSLFGFVIFLYMSFLSQNSNPLNRLVFRLNVTEGTFWFDYDKGKLTKIDSTNNLMGGTNGGLFFLAENPGTFQREEVICFVEKHGWEYIQQTSFSTDFIMSHISEKGNFLSKDYMSEIYGFNDPNWLSKVETLNNKQLFLKRIMYQTPFLIKTDCIVLTFHKHYEYLIFVCNVIINISRDQMVVCVNMER